jgi:Rad3-related DNA helicase
VDSPRDYGIPHDEFRPGQLEAMMIAREVKPGGVIALELCTGSGKTVLAAGVSATQPVTALMRTIALVDQYKYGYGFDAVYGRDQYPCEFLQGFQADACVFSDKMSDCPEVASCGYYIAREIVKASTKRSVSYAYYLHARWIQQNPGKLFCDEAHVLEDEILSHVSLEVSEKQRTAWGLPEFPGANGISDWANQQVADWARRALSCVPGKDKVPVRMHGARDRLINKLRQICTQIEFGAWYIQSSSTEGTPLSARPLSPGPFAGFLRKTDGTILLSATIGDAQLMADEFNLGYLYKKSFPHVIPKAQRPVYLLKDAPAMGNKATEQAFSQQAILIAKAIKQWPRDFRGVIHVSRWTETELLAKRLSGLGLEDRLWIPPRVGTRIQVEAFLADPRPGIIAIAPDWRTGLDFAGDKARLSIIAKIPFLYWGDPYIRARALRPDIGQRWYRGKAALDTVQACGRVVRGPEDFGVSYIVDSSWSRVAKYAPDWFEPETI